MNKRLNRIYVDDANKRFLDLMKVKCGKRTHNDVLNEWRKEKNSITKKKSAYFPKI